MATTLNPTSSTKPIDMLTFYLDKQIYGVPVESVARIIEMVTITRLPNLPAVFDGIINMQSEAVPVMNLRRRFNLPIRPYGLRTPIILTEIIHQNYKLGLIVDEVEDVTQVPSQNLEIIETFVPPHIVTPIATYIAGIAKMDQRMIVVLNIEALLNRSEQVDLSQYLDLEVNPVKSGT